MTESGDYDQVECGFCGENFDSQLEKIVHQNEKCPEMGRTQSRGESSSPSTAESPGVPVLTQEQSGGEPPTSDLELETVALARYDTKCGKLADIGYPVENNREIRCHCGNPKFKSTELVRRQDCNEKRTEAYYLGKKNQRLEALDLIDQRIQEYAPNDAVRHELEKVKKSIKQKGGEDSS